MSTVGDIKNFGNCKRAICLMTAQTVNTGAPAAATDGVLNFPSSSIYNADTGACFANLPARESTLMISSSAGSGTMVGTFTLWGYLNGPNQWFPVAINAAAATPNTAIALAETSADAIQYQQRLFNLGHYDRLFLQLSAVGGTATAFEAWLATGNVEA